MTLTIVSLILLILIAITGGTVIVPMIGSTLSILLVCALVVMAIAGIKYANR